MVAHGFQGRAEGFAAAVVAVVHEHHLGLLPEACQPVQQPLFVRVAGGAVEHGDLRAHRDVLAEELHGLRAVFQLPAERTLRLIAYEQDDVFLAPKVVLQMVADSARLAHAAGGENDLGLGIGVDELGFVGGNGQL